MMLYQMLSIYKKLSFVISILFITTCVGQGFEYKKVNFDIKFQSVKVEDYNEAIDASIYIKNYNSAEENTENIQNLLNEFKIVKLQNREIIVSDEGLSLNSGNILIFQTNTILRIKPNAKNAYELLRIHNVDDVIIVNPKLIGDRFKHKSKTGEQ